MDLKLTNNNLLSLGSTISSSITTNCTTVFVKNCPNVSGIAILKQCPNLTRVRLDIGSVSDSLNELLQYSTLNGFNDSYEPQAKPRLVGTWTVNNWYTTAQLTAAQAAFDGLTVQGDGIHLIDFSQFAVQTLDSTQPNYNPALSIILQSHGLGETLSTPIVSGGGRWYISKTDASAITTISTWFQGKKVVTDTNGICSSDTTATYNFTSGKEFLYFDHLNSSDNTFYGCTNLTKIGIPNSFNFSANGDWCNNCPITEVYLTDLYPYLSRNNPRGDMAHPFGRTTDNHIYINDVEVTSIETPYDCTSIGNCAFRGCKSITSITFGDTLTTINGAAFYGCTGITSVYLNNVTTIMSNAFRACSNLTTLTYKTPNTITYIQGGCFYDTPQLVVDNTFFAEIKTIATGSGAPLFTNMPDPLYLPKIQTVDSPDLNNSRFVEYGSNLTSLGGFRLLYGTCSSHLLSETPPTRSGTWWIDSWTMYVGDGSSAAHDDAILATYVANSNWSQFASKMDTWYNYLHPTT